MPVHKITEEWTLIAKAGESATVMNTGQASVIVGGVGGNNGVKRALLPPGGSYNVVDLRANLYASSEEMKAEVTTNITPGMPLDLI